MNFKRQMIYATPLNKEVIKKILVQSFVNANGFFNLKIAGDTFHSIDRISERKLSLKQLIVLDSIKKGEIAFNQWQVSEIRFLTTETAEQIAVSVVIDNVVFAVHPLNMAAPSPFKPFGLSEGKGFGLLKTVLEFPNQDFGSKELNGFTVIR